MHKYYVIISKIACLICISMLTWSCENKTEAPQTTQVVSKKISVAKTQKVAPATKKIAASAPAQKKQAAKPKPVAPAKKTTPAPAPVKQITKAPAVTPAKPKTADPVVTASAEAPAAKGETVKPVTKSYLLTGVYNSAGKLDPFLPLYKEKPVAKDSEKKKKKKKRRLPLTPLEKVDISQLKLVGVIRAPSGNKALVQEATGKGYIVKKGTYIGIHAGRVIDILKDRLVVEEEVETALGTYELQKREMKIQKPPGEL
ncbi:pilus assembly protein PilP [Thermodesulfobacteriota bacterium]